MSEEPTESPSDDPDLVARVRESEYFPILGFTIGVLLFPYVLVDGLQFVGGVIDISIGGYVGLPSLVLIYAIIVVGFNILLGFTGLLSFGHAAFFGTAAYTAGLFSWAFGDPIAMVIAGTVMATLIAWPIGFVSIRRTGVYFAVITLTFGQMLYFWALGPGAWLTDGDDGFSELETGQLLGTFDLDAQVIQGIPFLESYTWEYLFIGIIAIGGIWVANRIINSPYGLIFEALGENQQRVSFVGLDVSRYKLMAFIISAHFAGVGGSLFVMHEAYVHPNTAYYWIQSGDFVIMTILGGAGSLIGPVFGAFIFEYVSNIISGVNLPVIGAIGSLWRIVLGAVFVVIIWKFPYGIYPPIRDGAVRLGSWIVDLGGGEE